MTSPNFVAELPDNDLATLPSQSQSRVASCSPLPGAWQTEFSIEGPHDNVRAYANANANANAALTKSPDACFRDLCFDDDNPNMAAATKHNQAPDTSTHPLAGEGDTIVRDFASKSGKKENQEENKGDVNHPKRTSSLYKDVKTALSWPSVLPSSVLPHPHPLTQHPINMYRRTEVSNITRSPADGSEMGKEGKEDGNKGRAEDKIQTKTKAHARNPTVQDDDDDDESEEEQEHPTYHSPVTHSYGEVSPPPLSPGRSVIHIHHNSEEPSTPEQHSRAPANSFSYSGPGAGKFATSPDLRALEDRIPWETPSPSGVRDDLEVGVHGGDATVGSGYDPTNHRNSSTEVNTHGGVLGHGSTAVTGPGPETHDAGINPEGVESRKAGVLGGEAMIDGKGGVKNEGRGKGKGMSEMWKGVMGKGKEFFLGFAKQMKKGEMPWTQWYCCGITGGVECEQVNHRIRKTCKKCKHPVCENCVKGTL